MLRTVKIDVDLARRIKQLAEKRGQFVQYHLNEAIRQYLAAQSKEKAA